MPRRLKFTMEFEADLDGVPGWGHQPIDWIELVQSRILSDAGHYRTKAVLVGDAVEVDGIRTTNLGTNEFRTFYDPAEAPVSPA